MRGKIIKRGKNSYTIVLDVAPVNGKRNQQWISVQGNKKDAEKRLSEMLHQIDTGSFMRPSKTTVAEFLEQWLKDCRSRLSPRGFERYRDIVNSRLIPDFGSIALTQLRPEHIQRHETAIQERGLSARTARYHHSVIHSALKTAVEWGLLSRNPVDAVKPPKIHRTDMQTWDEGEMRRFLEAAKGSMYYELFFLALYTGMRRSELLALRWQDINLDMGQVSVSRTLHHLKDGRYVYTEPKSAKSRRTIALSPSAILLLKDYRQHRALMRAELGGVQKDADLVFCHILDGSPLRPNSITRAWQTAARGAGVKVIRLHDARHTHASIMLKQGIHPKIVQERLGHSTIQMTLDTYSHVAPGLQEAAAARFDEVVNPEQTNKNVGRIR